MERKKPNNVDFAGPLWEVLDRWKAAQQAVGGQAHSLFEAWLKCRTADIEQSMRFYREMASSRDPMDLLTLQQRFLLDAASRLQAEFQALGEKVASVAQQASARPPGRKD